MRSKAEASWLGVLHGLFSQTTNQEQKRLPQEKGHSLGCAAKELRKTQKGRMTLLILCFIPLTLLSSLVIILCMIAANREDYRNPFKKL